MVESIQETISLHDLVVEASANTYRKRGVETHKNTSTGQNKEVGGYYPDVIAVRENNKPIIEEIETRESITESSSLGKWAQYSKLGYRFILVVPKGFAETTKTLLNENNIQAYVQQYSVNSGQVIFYDSAGNIII